MTSYSSFQVLYWPITGGTPPYAATITARGAPPNRPAVFGVAIGVIPQFRNSTNPDAGNPAAVVTPADQAGGTSLGFEVTDSTDTVVLSATFDLAYPEIVLDGDGVYIQGNASPPQS
jgi:hypothetical protein